MSQDANAWKRTPNVERRIKNSKRPTSNQGARVTYFGHSSLDIVLNFGFEIRNSVS